MLGPKVAGLVMAGALVLSACGGGGSDEPAQETAPRAQAEESELHYVEFGDSWPEGAHCNGCQTFADLYGVELEALAGKPVVVTDLLGSQEPGIVGDAPAGSGTLLESLRSNETTQAAAKDADVILIATGPNEFGQALSLSQAGNCGGPDESDCIEALGAQWSETFDAILDEIDQLRAGRPTAVRLVSAANVFVSEEGINEGLPEDFATTKGARIFELLAQAMCDAASGHGAVCVDVRPILNGPTLDQSVDENSDATMRALADALIAEGLPELK